MEARVDDRCDSENYREFNESFDQRPEAENVVVDDPRQRVGVSDRVQDAGFVRVVDERGRDELGDTLRHLEERPPESNGQRERDQRQIAEQTVKRLTHRRESTASRKAPLAARLDAVVRVVRRVRARSQQSEVLRTRALGEAL
jgi:hypothetical protein